jgi:nickel-dependent lactate racemase
MRGKRLDILVTYGSRKIELHIPDPNFAGKIEPMLLNPISNEMKELERILDNPHGQTLPELVKNKSVCVLVEDHTRDAPHQLMISAVVPRLVGAAKVQFIITTGTHVVNHPGNQAIVDMLRKAVKASKLAKYDIMIHDCHNKDTVNLGKTSRGTPVIIDSAAAGHDVYVSFSDMKAHYFAGYSNVVKNFLPGVCSFKTVEANHAMALDPRSTFGIHPFHPDPERRSNPLADDMREAMELIAKNGKIFVLAVVSSYRKVMWASAGEVRPVTAEAMEYLDKTASFKVTPTTRVVVSPGGWPQDKSLYHAQRAIELTKNAVADNGEILFLAECRDGVAPGEAIENFYNKLKAPLDDVIDSISGTYHLYEHKAYKFAELLKRVARIRMYTELDRETVEAIHLEKEDDPQSVIDEWISVDPTTQILILDQGNKIAVYPE